MSHRAVLFQPAWTQQLNEWQAGKRGTKKTSASAGLVVTSSARTSEAGSARSL